MPGIVFGLPFGLRPSFRMKRARADGARRKRAGPQRDAGPEGMTRRCRGVYRESVAEIYIGLQKSRLMLYQRRKIHRERISTCRYRLNAMHLKVVLGHSNRRVSIRIAERVLRIAERVLQPVSESACPACPRRGSPRRFCAHHHQTARRPERRRPGSTI